MSTCAARSARRPRSCSCPSSTVASTRWRTTASAARSGGLALAGMLLGRSERSGRLPVLVVLLGTAAASLYGTLPASAWFYRLLQHAVVIDLPWKCLAVAVFCAAASFAVGLAHLGPQGAVRYGVVAVVLGLALWGNREHVAVPGWEDIPDGHRWRSAATSRDYDEY